jgi:NAD(P)H-hydrate repair Nnr-like enzyme with NAD(P)H-hydrate dehydratase domain
VGVTVIEPLIGSGDVLTDGEIVTAVAFEVCHCNETCCPAAIVVMLADNVAVGAGLSGLEAFELPQEDKPAIARIRLNRETGRRISKRTQYSIQTSVWSDKIQLLCCELLSTVPDPSQTLSSPSFPEVPRKSLIPWQK